MPGPATSPNSRGWLRRIAYYCWLFRRNVLLAFGASLVGMAINALLPLLPRLIIDDVIVDKTRTLAPWAGLMLLAAAGVFVTTFVRRYYGGRLAVDVQHKLRIEMFGSLARLDGPAQDRLDTGQVVGRATSDLQLVQGILSMVPLMTGNILMFVMSLVVMFSLSVQLSIVVVVVMPILWFVANRSRKRLFPATWWAQQQAAGVASVVDSAVTGVRVVKGFGQERQEQRKLEQVSAKLFAGRLRSIKLNSRYNPTMQMVPALGQVGMLAVGGTLAAEGHITLGTFVAFSTYLAQMVAPVRMLTMLLTVGQQARAGVERVFEVIDTRPELTERPDAIDLDPTEMDARDIGAGEAVSAAEAGTTPGATPSSQTEETGEGAETTTRTPVVDFDAVTFGYDPEHPVLQDFHLALRPGETLALVGGSGSGKSTVAMLLPRFYDVTEGALRVDGHDVRDLTLRSLRDVIGLVAEDSFLFSSSVRENIAYGRLGATDAEIESAARAAQAHDFITALPDGYETAVGEQGLTLSGGQRQRVALARAILSDPHLLVLDDATSAVDARVEALIHEQLHHVMRNRSTLLMAHRRSTLQLADRIAVLEDGRVLDVGTHSELLDRCALYGRLLSDPEAEPAAAPSDELEQDPHVEEDQHGTVDLRGMRGGGAFDPMPHQPREQVGRAPESGSEAEDTARVRGITPQLWIPQEDSDGSNTGEPADTASEPAARSTASQRTGMGRGLGGTPPSPEMVAQVEKLPPADDAPNVSTAEARAPMPGFTLSKMLRPFLAPLLFGLLLAAVDAAASLVLPILIRHGIDAGVVKAATGAVYTASAVGLGVVLLDWGVQAGTIRVTGRTGERLLYSLRVRIFSQLQRLGLDYYEREMTGRIMTRMTTDVDALSSFLQTGMVTGIVSVLTFFGILGALLVLDIGLALVVFTVLPVLIVATVIFRSYSSKAYQTARERISTVNADLQENVAGARVVQAFGRQSENYRRFEERSNAYRYWRVRAQRYIATYFPFGQFLSTVAAVLVLWVGAGRVAAGTLTPGELVAYLLYIELFFGPIQQLSQVFDGYQQAVVGLNRIKGLLRTHTSTPASATALPVERLRGDVVFDDVRFEYNADSVDPEGAVTREENTPAVDDAAQRPEQSEEALSGIRLTIPAGQTVAFVGETGAGKSTLVKLVARFYDVTGGAVLVDGTDVREFDMAAFRHRLGVVPQEAYLFPGTVRDAIAYGRPDASDADVESAARAVGAHQMIASLSGGYLHEVAERGRNLSAGQRQLLALARAELVSPDVLLLDEATAALDLATEAEVTAATERLSGRRTTLVIAHRLSTAARADRVVVMHHGQVVEDGTHSELLARDGRYARLWEAFTGDTGGGGPLPEPAAAV